MTERFAAQILQPDFVIFVDPGTLAAVAAGLGVVLADR
jgi:hypothetical protein